MPINSAHRTGFPIWPLALFQEAGYAVEGNRPYSGSIVALEYVQVDARAALIMIGINRGLYMDEKMGGKIAGFNAVRALISEICTAIQSDFTSRPLGKE